MEKVDDSCNKITDKVKLNLRWEGMFSFSSGVIKSLRVVKQKPAYSESMGSKLSIPKIIKEMKTILALFWFCHTQA
jgi:hypothetical protein